MGFCFFFCVNLSGNLDVLSTAFLGCEGETLCDDDFLFVFVLFSLLCFYGIRRICGVCRDSYWLFDAFRAMDNLLIQSAMIKITVINRL